MSLIRNNNESFSWLLKKNYSKPRTRMTTVRYNIHTGTNLQILNEFCHKIEYVAFPIERSHLAGSHFQDTGQNVK